MVLSEFQPLGRGLEPEPKIRALLSPSSLSLYVGQVCPGSSNSSDIRFLLRLPGQGKPQLVPAGSCIKR